MVLAENNNRKDEMRFIASVVLFILLMSVTMPVAHYFGCDGFHAIPFLLPAVVALLWMAREARLRGERKGCATPAMAAYNRRIIPASIVYMVAVVFAVTAHAKGFASGPTAYVIALLPALPILRILWIMGQFFAEETDEYQKSQMARRYIIATGFMLSIATVYGFLEQFQLVPYQPSYWAFILWCIGLGVAGLVDKFR